MDYASLPLADVKSGLENLAQETQATFGGLDVRQLNWRADAAHWSVAQCFDHLLTANRLTFQAAEDALHRATPRTVWQRLPIVPGVLGRMLVRSQAPTTARKFTAPSKARPGTVTATNDVTIIPTRAPAGDHQGTEAVAQLC